MGVRTPERYEDDPWPERVTEPGLAQALVVAIVVFLLLIANGRPIGAGDTRPTERVAASLVIEHDFDLDEYPDVEFPFAREIRGQRLSTYPVLSAVLAVPVFAAGRAFFELDETGLALCGKWAASLFSALAAAALFLAVGRRAGDGHAWTAALVFALGTSVCSTSQALWQHPAAVLALSLALLCAHRSGVDPSWADRAFLPLGFCVAARYADVFMAVVLALGLAVRFPRRVPLMLLWGAPAVLFVALYHWIYFGSPLQHGFAGSLGRFSEPWGLGQAGLLVSPGKGLLWFTPVVLVAMVGLVHALRTNERWLAATAGLAALTHLVAMGRWTEWHGGWCWGPRLLTDCLPLLFLFLPDGWALMPNIARLLAAVSIAVQMLGAFSYDNRWERLYQRDSGNATAVLWSPAQSPILFQIRERVLKLALPAVIDGHALIREHPLVAFAPTGSRVRFQAGQIVLSGSENTVGDVHLQRGARIEGEAAHLVGRWDALFLRVREGARPRTLELRVRGRGRGTLYVGERNFWSAQPHWTPYAMGPAFRVRHPYDFAQSGATELLVTVGKGDGDARIERVELVPPGDPEEVFEAPR
jgi:hypothetical protein